VHVGSVFNRMYNLNTQLQTLIRLSTELALEFGYKPNLLQLQKRPDFGQLAATDPINFDN